MDLAASAAREDNVFMARLCEQAERFDDMVVYMNHVAVMGSELTLEERNLFSVAFKNAVGVRRAGWRALSALEQKEAAKGSGSLDMIRDYKRKLEEEIKSYCSQIEAVLKKDLLPAAATPESKVFFYKLLGDYQRYIAEFSYGDAHSKCSEDAHEAYKTASDIALNELAPTHPVRLGLALNFSVFYYETLNSPERACLLAKAAFDDAIAVMDNLDEEHYKDSATIMQLLRDNLTLWTSDMQEVDQ